MLEIQTKTLLAVCGHGSFSKAAEALSLTQPAVSHQIASLENEYGVKIFVRGRGELRLTPEGEEIVRCARRLYALEESLHRTLADMKNRRTHLRVGMTETAGSGRIAEAVAGLGCRYEGLSINIVNDTIENLYTMLENFELELVISDSRPIGRGLRSVVLDTDHLLCILPPAHPLAKRASLTVSALASEKLLLRPADSPERRLFEAHLLAAGDTIDRFSVPLTLDDTGTLKHLVKKGFGVTVLPRSVCAAELADGSLAALPIENLPMMCEICLVCRPDFDGDDLIRALTSKLSERT